MLEWLTLSNEDCNKIGAIANIVTSSGVIIVIFSWVKSLRNFIESIFNFFKSLLVKIKSSMHSWLQEKIVGKENLETLKKSKVLKDNVKAEEFLTDFNAVAFEGSKVNSHYEALKAYQVLYSNKMDFNKFEKAYKEGNQSEVNKLRTDTFEELIKGYFDKFIEEYFKKNN